MGGLQSPCGSLKSSVRDSVEAIPISVRLFHEDYCPWFEFPSGAGVIFNSSRNLGWAIVNPWGRQSGIASLRFLIPDRGKSGFVGSITASILKLGTGLP
jgi:hypothetical protein